MSNKDSNELIDKVMNDMNININIDDSKINYLSYLLYLFAGYFIYIKKYNLFYICYLSEYLISSIKNRSYLLIRLIQTIFIFFLINMNDLKQEYIYFLITFIMISYKLQKYDKVKEYNNIKSIVYIISLLIIIYLFIKNIFINENDSVFIKINK
jgi:hypothetical protein